MEGTKPPEAPDVAAEEQTICFCHNVPRSRIVQVIRSGKASLIEIQEETGASTGCGGCEFEVLEILDQEKGPAK